MRTFTHGSGMDRKFVVIEVDGPRMRVIQGKSDGNSKRSEKALKSEAEARAACEQMARELITRGFVEQADSGLPEAKPAQRAPKPAANAKPAARASGPDEVDLEYGAEDEGEPAGTAAPVLPRLGLAPAATGAGSAPDGAPEKKKKKSGGKKKRKKAGGDNGLDKRVIAAVAAVGAAFVAFLGFMIYDAFLKPATIVGTWQGSRLEYEAGGPMSYSQYRLVLDGQKRASLTLQGDFTTAGTYTVKGDRLKLTLKDEDGETSEQQYKIALGSATLDLFDPASDKKRVQLVRLRDKPTIGGGTPPPAAPRDLAAGAGEKVDEAADARLASVAFSPKDGAFNLRHPPGWEPATGSRPDNTYSWARFTRGSAKIQVFADVQGSLMSGSDSAAPQEEGSELAPVHAAHMLYKKTASEEYSDYNESAPALFKGSPLGEGRIAAFTASAGDLFGSKLRGYRVTLLTNNRRVTVLCHCPEAEFETLKPTFLAVCRSVSP